MTDTNWAAVDTYIGDMLVHTDAVLHAAQQASVEAGLPAISVSAAQGKLLHLLARIRGAHAILEIGTLGGYSTIWMARALPPGGRLVTLEVDPRHAEVASANITRAQLDDIVTIRVGSAMDTLPSLVAEGAGPFDMIFIDADKPNIPEYFTWALALSRRGTVIVVDNVVRGGAVADADSTDPSVLGVRRFNELVASESRASATTIQTVGQKGYDGFTLVLVTEQ